jgi:hypothetical protein
VVLDLLVVKFLTKYPTKPVYFVLPSRWACSHCRFWSGCGALAEIFSRMLRSFERRCHCLTFLCFRQRPDVPVDKAARGLIMRVCYESQSKTDYRVKSIPNARPDDEDDAPLFPTRK